MLGKKFFSKLLKLIVSVFVLFIFAGCENFLNGGMLQTELEAIIADSKAQKVTIDFSGADGFGEIFVNGTSGRQFQIKEGKNFSLEFKVKEDYEFVGWSVETEGIKEARTGSSETDLPECEVPADETPDAENPIDKYIKIEETEELSTTVKIIKYADGIKIIPVCKVRPKIVTSGPENSISGVSRDRAVSATFTDIIPAENFSFADDEIPAEATPVYDEEGNIWAYETSQEGRILKNIEIKNSDGESVASHYKKPVFDTETKTLSIEADKDNPLQIEVGETKMVYVTLKKEIKGENGASLYQDKSWYFKATADTDEKAIITIKANSEEGRALNENSQLSYSILQKINLSFTENADWQFVRWDYDANIVNVIEPGNPNTIAQVINQTKDAGGQEHPSDIKAVCAKRPVVDAQNTLPKTQTGTAVSRDSSIHIVFDHNLPTDEAGKKQLENIAITVGGNTVKSSFKAPVINGKTVTFAADKNNLIGVNEGQTKTVTVTVPADFYYELDDDAKTKVVMGGNGFTYDYKIDSSTIDKAEIFVTAVEGSGTLTYTQSEENKYSIGQTIQLKFEPNAGYQFNGWKVKCGEDDVSEVDLKIADKTKTETTLTVYSALGGVTVNPDCSSLLSVIYTVPETSVEKDSDIIFSFNNKPEINKDDLSKITITIDGMNAAGMYSERSIEGKTVTIKNTQRPIVNKGDEKTVYVTVPKEYYYLNGTTKVYIENDYTFSFKINHTTLKKAEVSFAVVNGESEQYAKLADAGTLEECEETETLNLDEVKNLNLKLNEGYYFYGFKYLKSDGSDITSDVLTVTGSDGASKEIVFNKETEAARIYAVCYKLPTVLSSLPSSENEADTFPKNSPIEINLNHRVEDECKNKIRVSYTGGTISASEYFDVTIQNGTQIKLNPKMGVFLKLREGQSYETVTVTVPADIFYTDAVTGRKITMGTDDYVWSYKINNDTVSKTKVTFQNDSNDPNATLKANEQTQSSATYYECSQDQSFTLNYNLSSGYGFTGWDIKAPEGYKVEGGKVVYDGKTYFEIADVNSPDTTASSLIVIGNGIKISAGQYSIPKVDHLSVEYENSGIEFDNPVVIYFNNELNNDVISLKNSFVSPILTRFVSIVENGKEYNHLENYFALNVAGKTLKLTPKGDLSYFVKDENSTFDIKIRLNEDSNYLIKDSNNKPLEGNTEFVYRINGKTKAKTPINYIASNGNLYINEKKNTVNATVEYSFNNSSLVNINYEVNENYKFNKWNISVPEQYETVEEDGLFTVKKDEEVLFKVEDIYNSKTSFSVIRCIPEGITIEAEDVLILKWTAETPYLATGTTCDTVIKITFTKKLDASFLENQDFFSYVSMGSSPNEKDLNNLFAKGELGKDKQTLSIYPKSKEISETIGKNILDVYVTISKEMKDSDGYSIEYFYNSDVEAAKVRYIGERETTPPRIEVIELNDYDGGVCSEKLFDEWNKEEVSTNYCNNKVKIQTLDVFEEGSGIKKIKIKETLCYKPDGTQVNNATPSTKDFTREDILFEGKPDSDYGHYKLNAPFDYTFQTEEDGVLKLEITVEDEAQNSSVTREFYVIKDTYFNIKDSGARFESGEVTLDNVFKGEFNIDAEVFATNKNGPYNIRFLNKKIPEMYMYAYQIKYTYKVGGNTKASSEYKNFEYKDLQTDPTFINVEIEGIDAKASDIITITMKDAVGNEDSIDFQIPGTPVLMNTSEEEILVNGTISTCNKFTVNTLEDLNKADSNDLSYCFSYSILTRATKNDEWKEGKLTNCINSKDGYIQNAYDYVQKNFLKKSETEGYKIYLQTKADEKYYKNETQGTTESFIKGKLACIYDSTKEIPASSYVCVLSISDVKKGDVNSNSVNVTLKVILIAQAVNGEGVMDVDNFTRYCVSNLKFYVQVSDEYIELKNIKFTKNKNGGTSIIATPTIQVPIDTTEITLCAIDNAVDNKMSTHIYAKSIDKSKYNYDSFDTVPPEFSLGDEVLNTVGKEQYDHFTYSYNGEYIMAIAPTDNLGVLEEYDKNGKPYNPIDCYYLEGYELDGKPLKDFSDGLINIYSNMPHNKLKGRKVKYEGEFKYHLFNTTTSKYDYLIPVVDLEDDVSTSLYFKLYDYNDNYFAGVGAIGAIETLKNLPKVTYDQTNKKATVSISPDADKPYRNYSVTQFYWDTAESEWKGACATDYKFTEGASGIKLGPVDKATFMTLNSGNNKYEYIKQDVKTGLFGTIDTTDKFTKFTVRADHYKSSMDETTFDVPDGKYTIHTDLLSAFSYPVYYYTGEQKSEWTLGNMVEGNNGISILSNMPVYMHTITSNKDRGSNIDEWERRGGKIGQKYEDNKNFNYEFPLDEIEDGDYYVLVAYFANNTRVISSVYQK